MKKPYYHEGEKRPRLLVIGDAVAATGFARVMQGIFSNLSVMYEVHHLGINYHGDPHDYPWPIYPAKLGGDLQGVKRVKRLIHELNPDLVFCLNDIWVLTEYMKEIRDMEKKPKVVMYCPVDAGPLDPEVFLPLAGVDAFVVYSQFAKLEVKKALEKLRLDHPDFLFPEVSVIAHGVDLEQFFPLAVDDMGLPTPQARQMAITSLYGNDPEFRDAFIVLNANRNQPRKRIDITMKGFALFAQDKPLNVKLHLHMGVEDQGWDVIRLAKRLQIEHRLIITANGNNIPSVPVKQLNEIYNAAAVGINTSIGEGWGLVSFEHAAVGGAQIVPNHSSLHELWEGCALMMEPVMSLTTERILTEGKLVAPEQVAENLNSLYGHPGLLREMSLAAFNNARKPGFRWPCIAHIWHNLFCNVLAAKNHN